MLLIITRETVLWQTSSEYQDRPNYHPNSFDNIQPDSSYKNFEYELEQQSCCQF
ncbi:hypothetical protein [Chryseobacterium indoltheticum]|uniref:hypothetical protein n=1 Tax=Chryseobacterium indoltheticum TaxID=254 RepID=UPI003F491C71